MRRGEEILREVPHKSDCPSKNSTGYCKCGTYRALVAIEQAQREERVAIAEWLRTKADHRAGNVFEQLALRIERGEHVVPHREGQ